MPCRPSALAMNPATGDVLIGDDTSGQVLRGTPVTYYDYSAQTLITTCPVQIDGIAIRPAMNTFGASSGPNAPSWITVATNLGGDSLAFQAWQPNPGIPTLGNASFELSVTMPWPGPLCLFAISLANSNPPIPLPTPFSVDLLLDPGTAQLLSIQPAGWFYWSPFGGCWLLSAAGASAPLPIPNLQTLAGLDLFAQVFALEANAWSASAGLQFTLF